MCPPPDRSPPPRPAPDSPSAAPAPTACVLHGVRQLRLEGQGRIVLHLHGSGHVSLRRGRFDDFCFEGEGRPKHLSAEHVHLDHAEGRLTVEGTELVLDFHGGRADVEFLGHFRRDGRPA